MNAFMLTKAIVIDGLYPSFQSSEIPTEAKALTALCFVEAEKRPTFNALLPKVQMLLEEEDMW